MCVYVVTCMEIEEYIYIRSPSWHSDLVACVNCILRTKIDIIYIWIRLEAHGYNFLSLRYHCNSVIMRAMASQITSPTIVYSTVYSRRRSKKTSKLCVTDLCEGNSPVTGEFPAQRASNARNVSIWWRHHALYVCNTNWHLCHYYYVDGCLIVRSHNA